MLESEGYELEKWVWTQADYAQMGWHDVSVHALAVSPEAFELLFDIDYIIKWVAPVAPDINYSFWIVPATLVFENVQDVRLDATSDQGTLTILDLHRTDERTSPTGYVNWLWQLEAVEGLITLRASGYRQYLRQQPIRTRSQVLSLAERGGFSFSRERNAG